MTTLASVVGLIPVAVASGIAVQTTRAMHPMGKAKRVRTVQKPKRKKVARRIKRVTKSRSKSRNQLNRWIG